MPVFGQTVLICGLIASGLAAVILFAGYFRHERGKSLVKLGYVLSAVSAAALTICCLVLVYCFFAGNYSILYVLQEHTNSTGPLAWLFKLAGLWGGSQGSLLFWAWLISLFALHVTFWRRRQRDDLSTIAIAVMMLVLMAFMFVLVFSASNNPFQATPDYCFNDDGSINEYALMSTGMNVLLEHWAMAIHPPLLFIGYAGLTLPFAYALAAIITGDASQRWIELCNGMTVFAWLALGAGIGLGAVWAYVVLGWGGYWGWDPVENASLLSWLVGVALIHSFTIYRQRGSFKRWAVFCACLSFAFVILGTFITRSGIVESVHAFSGDPVSKWFFLGLIVCSFVAGVAGILIRRKSFEASAEIESLTSKNAAYYFGNVIFLVSAIVLAYLTLCPSFPGWMPFGGQELSRSTYESLARPIGIILMLLMAVCPLLSWRKTDRGEFFKNLKIPGICGAVMFAALIAVFVKVLYPNYGATLAQGGTWQENLLLQGPAWYYNGLAVLGLAVASLLFCNTVYLFVRGVRARKSVAGESAGTAFVHLFTKTPARFGGYVVHLGMAVMLVGLIGSNMYVFETTPAIEAYNGASVTAGEYTITARALDSEVTSAITQVDTATFDVTDADGNLVEQVKPSLLYVSTTQQNKVDASIIHFPSGDLFIAYTGITSDGLMSLDIKINPLIGWVWAGFILLMLGAAIACTQKRNRKTAGVADLAESPSDDKPATEAAGPDEETAVIAEAAAEAEAGE